MSLENTTFVSPQMTAEGEKLFPSIKIVSAEPKLAKPEFLGRNPFLELRRRAEHEKHLKEADAESSRKAKLAREAHERRKQQQQLEYSQPTTLPLTAAERTALEDNSVTQLFQAGRNPASAVVLPPLLDSPPATPAQSDDTSGGGSRLTSPSNVLRPSSSMLGSVSSFRVSNERLWNANQFIDQGEPLVSEDDAKLSKTQFVKHKKQKHVGYFGDGVDETNIYVFDPKPLLELPLETDRVVILQNMPLVLDKVLLIDDGPLKAIFGQSAIRMPRANGEMFRADRKQLEGSEPFEHLRKLRVDVTGKPPLPWAGDSVSLSMCLSSFSYTVKSYCLRTSAKRFPNIFQRFGVDLAGLAAVSPFPLRLDPNQHTMPTDTESIVVEFCAKTQLRVLSSSFRLKIFSGNITTKATLVVSGTLESEAPECELTLTIALPAPGFSFRSASRILSFLDVFTFNDFVIKLRRDQNVADTLLDSADEYMQTTLTWNLQDTPMLSFIRTLYGGEPTMKLSGLVNSSSTLITLRAEDTVDNRSMALWKFLKLRKIVGFVECDAGVTRFGVECIVGIPSGQDLIEFEGRLYTELTETGLSSINTPMEQKQQQQSVVRFVGVPLEGMWTQVGGQNVAAMKNLSLELTITCDTVLPVKCQIAGDLLLCGGDVAQGDAGLELPGVAYFTLDSFPDYAVVAAIAPKTALSDILSVLVTSDTGAGDEGDSESEEGLNAGSRPTSAASAAISSDALNSSSSSSSRAPAVSGGQRGLLQNNAVCCDIAKLLRFQKAFLTLNCCAGKCVTTAKQLNCPPGLSILVDAAEVALSETHGCLTSPCSQQHGQCSGVLSIVAGKGSAEGPTPFAISGLLTIDTPVALGAATCFNGKSPLLGPVVDIKLRINEAPLPDAAAATSGGGPSLILRGMFMLGTCPLVLHSLRLAPSTHSRVFSCTVHTTFLGAPGQLLQPALPAPSSTRKGRSVPEQFCDDKYFDLDIHWRSTGTGHLEIVRDNLADPLSGVTESIKQVLNLLTEEHLERSRVRHQALQREVEVLQAEQQRLAAAIAASQPVTQVTTTDCIAIALASRVFLSQYARILRRVPGPLVLGPNSDARDATSIGRLQHWTYSSALFRHVRTLDLAITKCLGVRAASASYNRLAGATTTSPTTSSSSSHHAADEEGDDDARCSIAREAGLAHELQMLRLAEREKLSVIADLTQQITLLEKCLVGFISLYSIDNVCLEGTSSLTAKGDASVTFLLNGKIRNNTFSSLFPLWRASVSQTELSNGVMYHAREMLRLVLISDPAEL